ncbi:threonyl-carbamoyl synthesis 1 [Halictus rubicundus]|uniref:threonyl-carbamoyl synthesis 1 n=1 Tax=Halictus rubicundus TaxID=77578 RepID=UPI0040375281
MLQSPMWSQLARLKFHPAYIEKRLISAMEQLGPMTTIAEGVVEELKYLDSKHWICKGKRSISIAAELLQQGKVVALATDTVYGLACTALQTDAIKRLYKVKGRDENKPLCISVSSIKYIKYWGVIDHLDPNLLISLLPGPYTIVVKRQPDLNPDLNPGVDTIGIRVPQNKFLNCVSHIVGPLALTSANVSGEPSCLHPKEFRKLWPQLDGIFYDIRAFSMVGEHLRKGSTIVDLSVPNHYKIVRRGVGANSMIHLLKKYGYQKIVDD